MAENPGEVTVIALAPLSNICAVIKKDPNFAKNVRNVVLMGGTYLSQGNTDYYCSEYNFFKDPDAASLVYSTIEDITMLPVETTFFQREFPQV